MRPHRPTLLTVHHSGVKVADDEDIVAAMQGLQRYSQRAKHWPDVPYHFVIGRNGQIAEGRNVAFAGDTNTGYDPAGHLLVCVEGNFEEQVPTAEQVASLKRLCAWLCQEYRIAPRHIHGHKHYATTACPGRNLSPLLPTLVSQ